MEVPGNRKTNFDEDTRLMLRLTDGDYIAYGRLYKKYFPVVVSYLTSLDRYQISSEDLAQEVFTRIWKNRKLFRADSSAKTYIFGISKNVLAERRCQIRHQIAAHNHSKLVSNPSKAEAVLDHRELVDTIKLAKSRLSDKQWQAIELVLLSGISITEAAQLAGCSISAFRRRLCDAKKRLLGLLKISQTF
ncbi:MAG: sigma-70 family RNA polymerase sigma factor [Aliifodinibius sp.]|nr:RNA polymerase sigma factor [Fodinibius sp.]NIV10586.1 sigma-70 family RNA polymerase sigma factor [Fodinibius sp.]NIY24214.1 sigma-70 family RNA polymerase sigma factor [Fodinibius sp.]